MRAEIWGWCDVARPSDDGAHRRGGRGWIIRSASGAANSAAALASAVFRPMRNAWRRPPAATPACAANPLFQPRPAAPRPASTGLSTTKEILMRVPAWRFWRSGPRLPAPARAQTYDPNYPVCLHVYGPIDYYDCSYTSLPQCAASASGRAAQCVVNPYFANAAGHPCASPTPSARCIADYRCWTIRARRPDRPPATPGGPCGPPVPCCGSRSASPPGSP